MNSFDQSITLFVNQYVGHSWHFDSLVVFLSSQDLLKGGLIFSLFWYAWFRPCEDISQNRQRLCSLFMACFVGLAIGRILQVVLPFRLRPLHTVELNFTLPHGLASDAFHGWSSLPSDHAVLFFALSTGLFLIKRTLGLLSFLHAVVVISLPRLYLGFHFATDLIAGALVGITSGYLFCSGKDRAGIMRRVLGWEKQYPAFFYSGFFLLTFEIARLFDDVESIAGISFNVLRAVFRYFGYS
jgi:undecaprenyl-diphosphatase